jgi:hypothetical protein
MTLTEEDFIDLGIDCLGLCKVCTGNDNLLIEWRRGTPLAYVSARRAQERAICGI